MKRLFNVSIIYGLICVFIISNLIILFSQKAYSAPNDLTSQAMLEAKQFTVTNALLNCLVDANGSGLVPSLSEEVDFNEYAMVFNSSYGNEVIVGHHVKPSNGVGGPCPNGQWVSSALSILGFSKNEDFISIFYDKTKNNWTLKKDFLSGNDSATDAFKEFLKASKEAGNTAVVCDPRHGCSLKLLSDSARYLLLLRNFVLGCGAKPSSMDIDDINSDSKERVNINIVNELGKINTVLYVMDKGLDESVAVGSGVTDSGKLTCNDIFQQINQYSIPFQNEVKKAIDEGQEVGNVNNVLAQLAKVNKPSCGQKTKSVSSWFICTVIDSLSKGMDAVMDQVDNMLNVDFSLLNTKSGDGLKNAWNVFRIMANFMLFAVAVVMIISQAMGGGS